MIGLVAIGFIGGYFTHAQMTKQHLRQVAREATIPGFEERLFRVLGLDEEQRKRLSPIVQEYAQQLHGVHSHVHQEREEILKSLRVAIKDELNDRQQERLERFLHRHSIFRPGERKLHHREKKPH